MDLVTLVIKNFFFLGGLFWSVQIENEYGAQSKQLGAAGHNYMTWAAKMAVEMGTGVPWVMCKEEDAPDPVVSRLTLKASELYSVFSFLCSLLHIKYKSLD